MLWVIRAPRAHPARAQSRPPWTPRRLPRPLSSRIGRALTYGIVADEKPAQEEAPRHRGGGDRDPHPEQPEGDRAVDVIDHPPEVHAEDPVTNVSGTKIVATTLTTYARSFSCRSSSIPVASAAASMEAGRRSTSSAGRSKYRSALSKQGIAPTSPPSLQDPSLGRHQRLMFASLAPATRTTRLGTPPPSSQVPARRSSASPTSSSASKVLSSTATSTS
jgi:hypothetical protein